MQKIRRWWGWIIQDDEGTTLGSVSNDGGESRTWNAVSGNNEIIATVNTRREAIDVILNQQEPDPGIFDRWVSANEILATMTESEFKIALFNREIVILETHLGQPRHGQIMGHGMFRLAHNEQ